MSEELDEDRVNYDDDDTFEEKDNSTKVLVISIIVGIAFMIGFFYFLQFAMEKKLEKEGKLKQYKASEQRIREASR